MKLAPCGGSKTVQRKLVLLYVNMSEGLEEHWSYADLNDLKEEMVLVERHHY